MPWNKGHKSNMAGKKFHCILSTTFQHFGEKMKLNFQVCIYPNPNIKLNFICLLALVTLKLDNIFFQILGHQLARSWQRWLGTMLDFSEQFRVFLKILPKDSRQRNMRAVYSFLPADAHSFHLHPVCSQNQEWDMGKPFFREEACMSPDGQLMSEDVCLPTSYPGLFLSH